MIYSKIKIEQEFIDIINQTEDVNTRDEYRTTLLYNTAHKGFVDASKLLCERGADVNAYNNTIKQDNVLNAACMSGNIELVEFLLNKGAKVVEDYATESGLRLMHGDGIITLLLDDRDDMVKSLLEKGWSPNSSSLNGSFVQVAIQEKKIEIFKVLLTKGAEIKEHDIELITKTSQNFQFIDVLLKSEISPLFLEMIFSEGSNNLYTLDEIIVPLCMQTDRFTNLLSEQSDIDLIGV